MTNTPALDAVHALVADLHGEIRDLRSILSRYIDDGEQDDTRLLTDAEIEAARTSRLCPPIIRTLLAEKAENAKLRVELAEARRKLAARGEDQGEG